MLVSRVTCGALEMADAFLQRSPMCCTRFVISRSLPRSIAQLLIQRVRQRSHRGDTHRNPLSEALAPRPYGSMCRNGQRWHGLHPQVQSGLKTHPRDRLPHHHPNAARVEKSIGELSRIEQGIFIHLARLAQAEAHEESPRREDSTVASLVYISTANLLSTVSSSTLAPQIAVSANVRWEEDELVQNLYGSMCRNGQRWHGLHPQVQSGLKTHPRDRLPHHHPNAARVEKSIGELSRIEQGIFIHLARLAQAEAHEESPRREDSTVASLVYISTANLLSTVSSSTLAPQIAVGANVRWEEDELVQNLYGSMCRNGQRWHGLHPQVQRGMKTHPRDRLPHHHPNAARVDKSIGEPSRAEQGFNIHLARLAQARRLHHTSSDVWALQLPFHYKSLSLLVEHPKQCTNHVTPSGSENRVHKAALASALPQHSQNILFHVFHMHCRSTRKTYGGDSLGGGDRRSARNGLRGGDRLNAHNGSGGGNRRSARKAYGGDGTDGDGLTTGCNCRSACETYGGDGRGGGNRHSAPNGPGGGDRRDARKAFGGDGSTL